MAPSIVAVLAIGGLLGLRHAFEPDHLAAVSTLATRPGGRRLWSAGRLGLIWGLGHTSHRRRGSTTDHRAGGAAARGAVAGAELLVAALLILLGAVVIWRYVRGAGTCTLTCTPLLPRISTCTVTPPIRATGTRTRWSTRVARSASALRTDCGEWRHCGTARRGRSRYAVSAGLLRRVQRRTIVSMLGVSLTLSLLVRFAASGALGGHRCCTSARGGERGSRCRTRSTGDHALVEVMTFGARGDRDEGV